VIYEKSINKLVIDTAGDVAHVSLKEMNLFIIKNRTQSTT